MTIESKTNIQKITITGLFAALIFVGTFSFKIPTMFGYTHLGDCFIIMAVFMLGGKRGALAGAIGAGLADLIGGYTIWVIPTMFIKASWALIAGFIAFKILKNLKARFWIAAIIGGLVHIALYTLVKIPLFGITYALSSLLSVSIQTLSGVILGNILFALLGKRLGSIIK